MIEPSILKRSDSQCDSFSGAAYKLYTRKPTDQEVQVIGRWNEAHPYYKASLKVPSDIAYDKQGHVHCGFGIPETCKRLRWVKLLLETDPHPQNAEYLAAPDVQSVRRAVTDLGKTPIEVTADYLRWLWDQVVQRICKDYEDESIIERSHVTIVMTVPAMWSDMAKDNTVQAAEKAGLTLGNKSLKFVTEPEAAAIASLRKQITRELLHKGDCVIVCDAGGGTVDVVSYEIASTEPFSMNQSVVADGNLCGSYYVEEHFEAQMKCILQEDWDTLPEDAKNEIRDRFSWVIKQTFNGKTASGTNSIQLSLPDDLRLEHIRHHKIHVDLSAPHLRLRRICKADSIHTEQPSKLRSTK